MKKTRSILLPISVIAFTAVLSVWCFYSLSTGGTNKVLGALSSSSHEQVNEPKVQPPIGNAIEKESPAIKSLYRNQFNIFDTDFSSVIYVSQGEGKPDAILMDATISSQLNIGVVKKRDTFIAIAELRNINLSIGNDENLLPELDQLQTAQDLLAIPFAFEYTHEGSIKNIHLSHQEDVFSSGVKRSIAARLQFHLSQKAGVFKQKESNEFGRYIAIYTKSSIGEVKKEIESYSELANYGNGQYQHELSGQRYLGNYLFGAANELNFITATTSIETSIEKMNIKADTQLSLNWKSASDRPLKIDIMDGYIASLLHHINTPDTSPSNKQKLAKEDQLNSGEFLEIISDSLAQGNRESVWNERDIFIESIIQNPENLIDVQKLLERGVSADEQALLLGALTDADSPEAQNMLAAIAANETLSPDVRSHALSHMALINSPTDETVKFLSSLVLDSELDIHVKETAVLALGGVIRSGVESSPENGTQSAIYEEAVRLLKSGLNSAQTFEEKSVYLMGLGNAGADSTQNALLNLSESNDASIRAVAIDSLRFIEGDAIDSKVASLISNDPDPYVRVSAIRSTIYRETNPEIDQALLDTVSLSLNDEERIAALSSLDHRDVDNETFNTELQRVARIDKSEKVREFANDIYQSRNYEVTDETPSTEITPSDTDTDTDTDTEDNIDGKNSTLNSKLN